jgi:HK97 family phage major capsid protein
MLLFELKKQREAALVKADAILKAAEESKRKLTDAENEQLNTTMAEVNTLTPQIATIESVNTIRAQFPTGRVIMDGGNKADLSAFSGVRKTFSKEYFQAMATFLRTRGKDASAALSEGFDKEGGYVFPTIRGAMSEGANAAGGFAVPSFVEPQIIPLAPPEFGVQSIATVIPTVADLRFPRQATFGTAATKAESGGSNNAFAGTDPTIEQFTLSAFMVGHLANASWELLQDVQVFQSFMTEDILRSIAILKEGFYVTGSGSGQPQGLAGNVGTGVTGEAADSSGNLLSVAATFDVMGVLKAYYYNDNTRWLMARATGIELRKAQAQSNLFAPVFTSQGGKDYLHGIEVVYSSSMPAIAAGATPVYLGDFKAGYIIGLRGGEGVNVKILDQPLASVGLLQILGYQRVDGRVRRSEAIQGITLHT